MTSNLRSARRKFAARRSGATASKSRNGWYTTMDRPRRAHSSRIRPGDHADALRSFSNNSTLSNRAAAAADSLSSKVPDRHTVAMARRGLTSGSCVGGIATVSSMVRMRTSARHIRQFCQQYSQAPETVLSGCEHDLNVLDSYLYLLAAACGR